MREIKFRAWNKDKKCMFLWDLSMGFAGTNKLWSDVMQYTGLKDKNGTEIYEGDILTAKLYPHYVERVSWKGPPDVIGEVYWDLSCYGFAIQNKFDKRYSHFSAFEDVNYDECVVIGNIYQNPELLEN